MSMMAESVRIELTTAINRYRFSKAAHYLYVTTPDVEEDVRFELTGLVSALLFSRQTP